MHHLVIGSDYCCYYYCLLSAFLTQGQNSIPDVIISMLSGKKRLAYARIPAHEVMYAHDATNDAKWKAASGRNCGRPQTVYMKVSGQTCVP